MRNQATPHLKGKTKGANKNLLPAWEPFLGALETLSVVNLRQKPYLWIGTFCLETLDT